MKTKAKNIEIASMIGSCEQHLDDNGLLGYACARNARMLTQATVEYIRKRDDALKKYGAESKDAAGRVIGMTINDTMPGWNDFKAEMSEYDDIEHDIDLFKVKASKLVGSASGRDLLALDFMIEWDDPDDLSD